VVARSQTEVKLGASAVRRWVTYHTAIRAKRVVRGAQNLQITRVKHLDGSGHQYMSAHRTNGMVRKPHRLEVDDDMSAQLVLGKVDLMWE
jgi:hypothetical protein